MEKRAGEQTEAVIRALQFGRAHPVSTNPVPRWTHYGRWDADGLRCRNERGDVVWGPPDWAEARW